MLLCRSFYCLKVAFILQERTCSALRTVVNKDAFSLLFYDVMFETAENIVKETLFPDFRYGILVKQGYLFKILKFSASSEPVYHFDPHFLRIRVGSCFRLGIDNHALLVLF